MLEVTELGIETSERLWHQKSVKDDKEMAFLAAVSVIEEYAIMDAYDLAKHIPFIHGFEAKHRAVKEWIEKGLLEKSQRTRYDIYGFRPD